MGCLKKVLGLVLFLGGLVGFLYYLTPAFYEVDPTTGLSLLNFMIKHFSFLSNNYQNMIVGEFFGIGSPLLMFVISVIALILGLILFVT